MIKLLHLSLAEECADMTRTNLVIAVGFAVLALIGAPCRAEAGASLPISAGSSVSDVSFVTATQAPM